MKKYLVGIIVFMLFMVTTSESLAANFLFARVRYDRMKQNSPSSVQVTLVPASVATENKITIVFGSATVGAGQSASTIAIPAGTVGLPGTLTAVGSGTSITITGVTDLAVGTTYAFNLMLTGTSAGLGVTTPAAGATTDTVQSFNGTTPIDSTRVASRYITDDQVVITANVPPTFTFVLSGNTDTFTTDLGASAVALTYGVGISVSTNAARGWTGWIKSANAALSSATTGESVATSGTVDGATSTCSGGSDCYNLSVSVTSGAGTGAITADPEYAGNGTTTGGSFSTTYQPFATRTGKTAGDSVTFKALASIIGTKAAGSDYTDTWTIVGAGNF